MALLGSGTVVVAADWFYLTTIPLLSVANPGDKPIGAPSYAIIQVAHLSQPLGPEVLFNEGARGLGAFQGSVFGADWKEAAQKAALAASRAVGEDPRTWQVTLKGASPGQIRTPDWDLRPLAEGLNVKVIEVPTIIEAYERMTGKGVP